MISCDSFLAELGNLLDNQVSPEARQHLEWHLAHCRHCEVLYDSTRKTITIVTESNSFELPESVSESIVNRIMAQLRREGSKQQQDPSE